MNSNFSLPDPLQNCVLSNGHRAAVCVNSDGTTTFWLIAPTDSEIDGCACRSCAPHEHNGLPKPMREALHMTCRRARSDGNPCLNPVSNPGQACRWHTDKERIS